MDPMNQSSSFHEATDPRAARDALHEEDLQPDGGLVEHGRQIQMHAAALYKEVGAAIQEARHFIETSVQSHPYATLSAAAGAGYVIAGGLSSSVTRLAFKAGSRLAAAWALKELTSLVAGAEPQGRTSDEP